MATQMIKHTLGSSWAKVASGASTICLQGFPGTYQVYFSDTPPPPGATGLTPPSIEEEDAMGQRLVREGESFVLTNFPRVDIWVKSLHEYSAGNIVHGLAS